MKKKIDLKKHIKIILPVVLAALILVGTVGLISASFSERDMLTISSSKFSRGALDSSGKYVESDRALYTSEMFGCHGLKITPNIEFQGTYDVYFYDVKGAFVSSETNLTDSFYYDYPSLSPMYARVVIYPELSKNDSISRWEIRSIAKQITVEVDRYQKAEFSEVYDFKVDICTVDRRLYLDGTELAYWESEGYYSFEAISLSSLEGDELKYLSITAMRVISDSDRSIDVYGTDSQGKSFKIGTYTGTEDLNGFDFDIDLRKFEDIESVSFCSKVYLIYYITGYHN